MRDGQKESDQQAWDEQMKAIRENSDIVIDIEDPLQTVEKTEKEMPGVPVVKIPLP